MGPAVQHQSSLVRRGRLSAVSAIRDEASQSCQCDGGADQGAVDRRMSPYQATSEKTRPASGTIGERSQAEAVRSHLSPEQWSNVAAERLDRSQESGLPAPLFCSAPDCHILASTSVARSETVPCIGSTALPQDLSFLVPWQLLWWPPEARARSSGSRSSRRR